MKFTRLIFGCLLAGLVNLGANEPNLFEDLVGDGNDDGQVAQQAQSSLDRDKFFVIDKQFWLQNYTGFLLKPVWSPSFLLHLSRSR